MIIRTATEQDANAIAKLGRETFLDTFGNHPKNKPEDVQNYVDESFTEAILISELNDPDTTFFVVEIDHALVGYMKIKQNVTDNGVTGIKPMELCRIYVSKQHMGKGIGKELMLKCFETAKEKQNDVVWLGVWEYNYDAQTFYKKFAFSKCGEHVFQLGSDPQTDWIMQRHMN